VLGDFTAAEVERLDAAHSRGALALVLVLHGPLAAPRWCPLQWREVREWERTHQRRSIPEAELLRRATVPARYLEVGQ
jgi:hypothetical protein